MCMCGHEDNRTHDASNLRYSRIFIVVLGNGY